MTLNSPRPGIQGPRRKDDNQLFYNRSHFPLAMTDSRGKGSGGTVSGHVEGMKPSGLQENFPDSCEPGSEDARLLGEAREERVGPLRVRARSAVAGARSRPQARGDLSGGSASTFTVTG